MRPADPGRDRLMAERAGHLMLAGRIADALRISDDAQRLADESLARQGRQYPVHISRGQILVWLDRLEEGRSTLQAGRRMSEERGVRWPLPSFGVFLGVERFLAGEWDNALAEPGAAAALRRNRYARGQGCDVRRLSRGGI